MSESAAALQQEYSRVVRPKLDLVDDLHRILGQDSCVPLPRIAVLGTQSCGKTSVLERLSRIALPRGEGLCTRAPLMLALKNSPQESKAQVSYSQSNDGVRVDKTVDISQVGQAVDEATNAVAGANKGISQSLIKLNVCSPGLPDLTLIDLPGITYTPVGDQPDDIGQQVKALIKQYIVPKETIILCVFAGDVDLQASEALMLAREVDPLGDRTLGVITKIDRMQSRACLRDAILQTGANSLNVKLGLVAMRNKSPDEISQAVSPDASDDRERKFFQDIEGLQDMPTEHLGVRSLASRLCSIQCENLDKVLPTVKENLAHQLLAAEKELKTMPGCCTPAESFGHFQRIAEDFKTLLFRLLEGQYDELDARELGPEVERKLYIRPRVDAELQKLRATLKRATKSVFLVESTTKIEAAIERVTGQALPNMLSDTAFKCLIRDWHKPFDKIVHDAMAGCIDCISDVVDCCIAITVKRTPRVQPLLQELVHNALELQFATAENDVARMLEKERVVVYTLNSNYQVAFNGLMQNIVTAAALKEDKAKVAQAVSSLKTELHLDDTAFRTLLNRHNSRDPVEPRVLAMQLSLCCYNKVVRKRIVDGVMQIVHLDFLTFLALRLGDVLSNVSQEQAHDALRATLSLEQKRIGLEARVRAYKAALQRVGGESAALARGRRTERLRKRQISPHVENTEEASAGSSPSKTARVHSGSASTADSWSKSWYGNSWGQSSWQTQQEPPPASPSKPGLFGAAVQSLLGSRDKDTY